MKLEQAARQLLEIAEGIQHGTDWNNGTHAKIYRPKFPAAITAMREALAEQAGQEPVAWALSHSFGLEFSSKYPMQTTKEAAEQMARQHMGAVVVTPLYAAPIRVQDLTDDEIDEIYSEYGSIPNTKAIRAVIAAYKEKNK